MEYFVTKEQVKRILEHHGHHVVMDSAFVTGAPMTEIEAIVDVCDVVAQAAYDHGVKDAAERRIDLQNQMAERVNQVKMVSYSEGRNDAIKEYGTDSYVRRCAELNDQIGELQEFNQQLRVENKQLCETVEDLREANRGLADSVVKKEINESEELEKAINEIQAALSGSFRDNLRLEVSEQHAWLNYGDLKFLVEPMEAWQAVQSCVYLSGLEVDNE